MKCCWTKRKPGKRPHSEDCRLLELSECYEGRRDLTGSIYPKHLRSSNKPRFMSVVNSLTRFSLRMPLAGEAQSSRVESLLSVGAGFGLQEAEELCGIARELGEGGDDVLVGVH